MSADHWTAWRNDDNIRALAGGGTLASLVPGSNYFLAKPYPPARKLIDAGAAVALATDFNPGTCPCWDMRMILSIACTQMRMTPEEALVAATFNGAWALGLGKTLGSLEREAGGHRLFRRRGLSRAALLLWGPAPRLGHEARSSRAQSGATRPARRS